MTWDKYVQAHAPGLTQTQIANRLGLSQGTVSRWLTGSDPKGAHVVRFVEEFGGDLTEAFLHSAGMTDRQVSAMLRRIKRPTKIAEAGSAKRVRARRASDPPQ